MTERQPAAGPARLYRVLALAETVTWALLLLGMLGKYVLNLGDLGVRIGGGIHGFVFLAYAAATILIAIDQQWKRTDLVLGIASAIVPFATIPFERRAERNGLLSGSWRLHTNEPGSVNERVVALAVRRPLVAGAVAVALVSVVFAGLLAAGPPGQWFS